MTARIRNLRINIAILARSISGKPKLIKRYRRGVLIPPAQGIIVGPFPNTEAKTEIIPVIVSRPKRKYR